MKCFFSAPDRGSCGVWVVSALLVLHGAWGQTSKGPGGDRFSGKFGGVAEGERVPKVSAVDAEGRRVDLSDPKRFTVLVFGSHT